MKYINKTNICLLGGGLIAAVGVAGLINIWSGFLTFGIVLFFCSAFLEQ